MDPRITTQQPRKFKPRKKVSSFGKLKPPDKIYKPMFDHDDAVFSDGHGNYRHVRTSTDY